MKRDGRWKGSRFSEEQIIGVLREHEAGAKTEEVCRRHGISARAE
jgi:putative transposase